MWLIGMILVMGVVSKQKAASSFDDYTRKAERQMERNQDREDDTNRRKAVIGKHVRINSRVNHHISGVSHHHSTPGSAPTAKPTQNFMKFLQGGFGTPSPTGCPTKAPSSYAPTSVPTNSPTSAPTKLFSIVQGMQMSGSTLYAQCTKHGRWARATKVVKQIMATQTKGKKMSPNTLKAIVKACIDGLESSWRQVFLEATGPTPSPSKAPPTPPTPAPTISMKTEEDTVKKVTMLRKIALIKKDHGLMGPHLTIDRSVGTIGVELQRLEQACKASHGTDC
jgi:hypothetical protein